MGKDFNVELIKKLWILDLIVREGSLKAAALHARISPSAVSQSLKSLEESFGQPLLIREKGKVRPTHLTLSILETVVPAFEAFDKLKLLNNMPIPQVHWINFGTYESIAIDILPSLVRSLKEKLPSIKLKLRISRTSSLLTMVRKGELCSALVTQVDDLDRFYVKEVGRDRFGLYVSAKHPIRELGWTAMTTYGLGALSPGSTGLPRYFSRFTKTLKLLAPSLISDSFETICKATAAGLIVGMLPDRVAARADSLIEISSNSNYKAAKALSEHKLLVVSQLNCDKVEADFIAEQSRLALLNNS